MVEDNKKSPSAIRAAAGGRGSKGIPIKRSNAVATIMDAAGGGSVGGKVSGAGKGHTLSPYVAGVFESTKRIVTILQRMLG